MRYYISDLHFFHANMNIRMDNRGFASAEEMNAFMVKQWKSKVRRNDEIVVLGDLSIARWEQTKTVLTQLPGRLHLIRGNHDKWLDDRNIDLSRFEWVKDYAEMNDNGRKVILSHYPTFCYNGQYRVREDGSPKVYMLYGHVHNTMDQKLVDEFQELTRKTLRTSRGKTEPEPIPCNMINCFCMYSNYVPWTLDEWIAFENKRMEKVRRNEWIYN